MYCLRPEGRNRHHRRGQTPAGAAGSEENCTKIPWGSSYPRWAATGNRIPQGFVQTGGGNLPPRQCLAQGMSRPRPVHSPTPHLSPFPGETSGLSSPCVGKNPQILPFSEGLRKPDRPPLHAPRDSGLRCMAAEFPPHCVISSKKFFGYPKKTKIKRAGHKPVLPLLGHVDGVRVCGAVHLLSLKNIKKKGPQIQRFVTKKGTGSTAEAAGGSGWLRRANPHSLLSCQRRRSPSSSSSRFPLLFCPANLPLPRQRNENSTNTAAGVHQKRFQ